MDAFDHKLLALVQDNCRLTIEQLSQAIGLSPAASHRRLNRLRASGVIEAEVALVAPAAVRRNVTIVVQVTLEREHTELFESFKADMRAAPEVQQCYYVAGGTDFIIVLTAKDMQDYNAFTRRHFHGNPNIQRFQTNVVMDRVKFTTALPVPAE